LRQLPGWEAIKLTRGHYRSCGRDPAGCCVSDLLRDEPVIRSGREANYQAGKDTGLFWDAGASNVHWVIVKDNQVERGIKEALARVETDGVIVEGNSFLDYVTADLAVMCARADGGKVKPSARRALMKSDLLYFHPLMLAVPRRECNSKTGAPRCRLSSTSTVCQFARAKIFQDSYHAYINRKSWPDRFPRSPPHCAEESNQNDASLSQTHP
jgi:hypothetical protein